MNEFEFTCGCCGEVHRGIPTFAHAYPLAVLFVPEDERESRVQLDSNTCVIDGEHHYLRGCIEIPVAGATDPFIWGAWVEISPDNFKRYVNYPAGANRELLLPFHGYLSADYNAYHDSCDGLQIRVHPRNDLRPYLQIKPGTHVMADEQENGISIDRLAEIYAVMAHKQPLA